MLKHRPLCRILTLLTSLLFTSLSQAGGVSVGATRIIYPSESKEVQYSVRNSDEKNVFLIQSWIDDEYGQKSNAFILTPPIFVIKEGKENLLRIMNVSKTIRNDRETLFWLTVKAIPEMVESSNNTLKLAIASRIKMFYRPAGLTESNDRAREKISFKRVRGELLATNPTPYYITLVNAEFNGMKIKSTMLPPFSESTSLIKIAHKGVIKFQTINDYGANTPPQQANIL